MGRGARVPDFNDAFRVGVSYVVRTRTLGAFDAYVYGCRDVAGRHPRVRARGRARGARSRGAAHVDARARRSSRARDDALEVDGAKPRRADDALERADARRDDDDATATRSDEDVDGDGDERAVDDRSIRWDHRR